MCCKLGWQQEDWKLAANLASSASSGTPNLSGKVASKTKAMCSANGQQLANGTNSGWKQLFSRGALKKEAETFLKLDT